MPTRIGSIEDMGELLLVHSLTCVGDAHLHTILQHLSTHHHLATFWRKLSSVVGDGINHEECERTVGLHLGGGRLYIQLDALHQKSHLTLLHDVEEGLKREADDAKAQCSLSHLNPLGQYLIVLIDLVGQFGDILVAFLFHLVRVLALYESIHLVYHSVDEWRNTIDERYLGTLLQVASLIVGEVQTSHLQLFI